MSKYVKAVIMYRSEIQNHDKKNKAFFLDRDGIIIKNIPYLSKIELVEFLDNVDITIRKINQAGYKCVVITNQSGIARGTVTIEQVELIHKFINKKLEKIGARIDAFYVCPHHPDGKIKEFAVQCSCRKPKPGLLFMAANEHDIDLSASIMIGDQESDYMAGVSAGCNAYLVSDASERNNSQFSNLDEIVDHVLSHKD